MFQFFSLQVRQNTKKKKKKNWCDFEAINVSCMVCIKRNATRFSSLQTKTNRFNKKGKQQASGHHKKGFAQNSNKNMNIKASSFANSRSPQPNVALSAMGLGLDS